MVGQAVRSGANGALIAAPADHSNMAHDCQPYWLRDQDTWTKIDYKKEAKDWMKPLVRGNETGMVEIPASWDVRDPALGRTGCTDHGPLGIDSLTTFRH